MARSPTRRPAKKSRPAKKKISAPKPILMSPEQAKKTLAELTPNEAALDAFDLRDIAAKHALPVLYLSPGRGKVVAKFDCDDCTIAVDLRSHPDAQLRSSSILVVGRKKRCELVTGATLDEIKGGTQLVGRAATDTPEVDALFLEAPELLAWFRQLNWKPEWGLRDDFEGRDASLEYDETWRAGHPLFAERAAEPKIWAQLGGWPMTWPDEAYADQQALSLVLRTYARSEPWLEVLRTPDGEFHLLERTT